MGGVLHFRSSCIVIWDSLIHSAGDLGSPIVSRLEHFYNTSWSLSVISDHLSKKSFPKNSNWKSISQIVWWTVTTSGWRNHHENSSTCKWRCTCDVREMQRHIKIYVKNKLFCSSPLPPLTFRRYNPKKKKNVCNHMYIAAVKLKFSKLDQENLIKS